MLDTELGKQVVEIIAEELSIDKSDVKLDSTIDGDLNADSLDIMQLIMAIEDKFDCEFSDDDAKDIKTVQQVIERIQEKQSSK